MSQTNQTQLIQHSRDASGVHQGEFGSESLAEGVTQDVPEGAL